MKKLLFLKTLEVLFKLTDTLQITYVYTGINIGYYIIKLDDNISFKIYDNDEDKIIIDIKGNTASIYRDLINKDHLLDVITTLTDMTNSSFK